MRIVRAVALAGIAIALAGLVARVSAQAQVVPFDSDRWEIRAVESKVVSHLGRQSFYLKGGLAVVKDSQFLDGVIEFDLAFSTERGFLGAVWRLQDSKNYEDFYVRPHQSGNPDANQYQPVFNGDDAWQLYYGDGYGAPVKYDFDQWIHIKIAVSGKHAEVYIRDMEKPALVVNELKRETKAGKVGLSAGNYAPAYYSNFSFNTHAPVLKGKPAPAPVAPAGTVMSWQVSDVIEGKSLDKKYQMTASDQNNLQWTKLGCEATGICNLARVHGVEGERNTVFAKLLIHSESEQTKPLALGFSDMARVYLNGRLLYAGSDIYRSRDYRFLGTMGLFDELYLPLRKGDNELWVAVTESFGGWGIKAQFEDMEGLKLF